jgi:hypothetical protein
MRKLIVGLFFCCMWFGAAIAQTQIDTFIVIQSSDTIKYDTVRFWLQLPPLYNPRNPPAILIWWHQLGANQLEMHGSAFDEQAALRGWIAASHAGPELAHWNAYGAQLHCRLMLDWIMQRFPFSRDSIYMIGGSMGGAAGQVWHNNNCGPDDYLIAATAGGSQILDCQLRQEQYLAVPDTNRSMRRVFGGLPSESPVIAFEYHRASAVFLADTTQSMHYNGLHLPVWNTWGANHTEDTAYGEPAQQWLDLRRLDHADTTWLERSSISGHGMGLMPVDVVCDWLSRFTANRYPDWISINADEDDDYYWTTVTRAFPNTVFGRYGVTKNPNARSLSMALIRNVGRLQVNFIFPWPRLDSLHCHIRNLDPAVGSVVAVLNSVPRPESVRVDSGEWAQWEFDQGQLSFRLRYATDVTIVFSRGTAQVPNKVMAADLRIIAAYPNPFNSTAWLEVESPRRAIEHLTIYDLLGREVLSRVVELSAGSQRIAVDAGPLSTGIYFVKLEGSAGPPVKIVLLR